MKKFYNHSARLDSSLLAQRVKAKLKGDFFAYNSYTNLPKVAGETYRSREHSQSPSIMKPL